MFHGRIHVHKGADKTDAKQTNKNLLLSDRATIDTKPQLEIYADDVKCTHGATIGQMNAEQIFTCALGDWMRNPRRMICTPLPARSSSVVHEAAREELDRLVWDRLEQMGDRRGMSTTVQSIDELVENFELLGD